VSLEDHLRRCKGKDVTVLLNPGNAGDGLIHLGARTLFAELGLDFRERLYPADLSGEVLLVHGCGGFGGVSAHRVEQSRYYFDRFREVLVLPSSFDTGLPKVREYLKQLPSHVTVYCREKVSFEQAAPWVSDPGRLFLSEDLAFQCEFAGWKQRGGEGTLAAFRTDQESAVDSSGIRSIDVSRFGDKYDAWPLLDVVSRFEKVHTDRMHVGVAASMMGKQTYLYDNSYHKIRAVYDYSLAGMQHVRYLGSSAPEIDLSDRDIRRMSVLSLWLKLRKPTVRALRYLSRKKFKRPFLYKPV